MSLIKQWFTVLVFILISIALFFTVRLTLVDQYKHLDILLAVFALLPAFYYIIKYGVAAGTTSLP